MARSRRSSLAIGKPIEHGLRTYDEEAPEFVIDANLPATQKGGYWEANRTWPPHL